MHVFASMRVCVLVDVSIIACGGMRVCAYVCEHDCVCTNACL